MNNGPVKYRDILKAAHAKALLPTTLGSAELMQIDAQIRSRCIVLAKVTNAVFVNEVAKVHKATTKQGATMSELGGVQQLKETLDKLKYVPPQGKAGTIEDLSSHHRLKLIVGTMNDMTRGYGYWIQSMQPEVINEYPAFEFRRAEDRIEPRDWPERWRKLGGKFYLGKSDYPDGRMIALKTDPIWIRLSAFGLPHAPFDYNSGMDIFELDKRHCMSIGVVNKDTKQKASDLNFPNELPMPELEDDIRDALIESLGAEYELVVDADGNDILTWA